MADFLPEFAAEYSPPTKRPRHSGRGYPDYQHMVTRGPRGSGGGSDDEQSEEGGEDTAAAGAGAGAAATDSDEQKSNLALLLEAADEIDRAASGGLEEEDDRYSRDLMPHMVMHVLSLLCLRIYHMLAGVVSMRSSTWRST